LDSSDRASRRSAKILKFLEIDANGSNPDRTESLQRSASVWSFDRWSIDDLAFDR
jgi:hypothetical protein